MERNRSLKRIGILMRLRWPKPLVTSLTTPIALFYSARYGGVCLNSSFLKIEVTLSIKDMEDLHRNYPKGFGDIRPELATLRFSDFETFHNINRN